MYRPLKVIYPYSSSRSSIYLYLSTHNRFRSHQQHSASPNLYQVLGIPQNASVKEIKTAYYKKCKENHPDMMSKSGSTKKSHDQFIQIQRAYDVLSQVSTRKAYDIALNGGGTPSYSGPIDPTRSRRYPSTMSSYHYDDFERYMRHQQKFSSASSTPYRTSNPNSVNFGSPLRVMLFCIVALALIEVYSIRLIYNQDINENYPDNQMNYSPFSRHGMRELRRQVHYDLDPREIEEKIKKSKEA